MTSSSVSSADKAETLPTNALTVRLATPQDDEWVEQLQAECFGPGRFARAAFRVRELFPIDPTLSLIAELDRQRVATVCMTPISLSGVDGYLLGPLATDPAMRGKGAGRRLVIDVTQRALARGEGNYVLLVGDAPYYGPLGFAKTTHGAITFPGPVDPDRVLVYCNEAGLGDTLAGEVSAFGAEISE